MGESKRSTQLAVVGAGPGGYAAAFLASDLGLDATLIDPEPNPGGVCLYRGCIPSKALLHLVKVMEEAREAERWGVRFGEPKVNLNKLRAWKDGVVSKLTSGLGLLARRRGLTYLRGRARFLGDGKLEITTPDGGARRLAFEHAIVATGSRPAVLTNLPAEDRLVFDSTAALHLAEIPKRLLVVGGGYIGLEIGSVYATLGSRVTLVEATSSLLPGVDSDLVRPLARRLERTFESILLDTQVARFRQRSCEALVTLDGKAVKGSERSFDRILVSIGRVPNSGDLGLDRTRAEVDGKGFLQVDARRRTADPTISAIGDVAGQPMLAHKATHEGRAAVEAIAGHPVVFEPKAIPAVVFTDPEIAWCGLTESEAARQKRDVEVVRYPWAASGRAATIDRAEGVTKLVLEPASGRLLGAGIAGSGAGELIAEAVLAVEMAAVATDLRFSIHPHPTLSETIMEAADLFFGQSTHLVRPKKS